jgi:hypothetical protein
MAREARERSSEPISLADPPRGGAHTIVREKGCGRSLQCDFSIPYLLTPLVPLSMTWLTFLIALGGTKDVLPTLEIRSRLFKI